MKKAGTNNSAENLGTFTARRDDLTITVTESGSVKAQESTDVMCEVEGRGVEISSIITEGTVIAPEDVANGKIICQLNASDLQDRHNKELIDFSSSKASYIQAQEAYQIQIKQNESDIAAAKLAVEFGLMDLQNHLGETTAKKLIDGVTLDPNANIDMAALRDNNLGGSASQQLKTLEDAILLARGNLERAIDVNEGTQKLYDANYASELELTGARLDVQRYQIQMESSVNMVKPGQKATITVEAYPDIPLEGKVLQVAPLPDPPHGWFDPSVKVYTTQITIDGAHDILKPGMSAKVEVLIEQLKNVLIVPIQVVANREGKKVCYIATPQGPKQRQVQTGSFNDTYVHIISGLEAGEQVLLIPPKLTESE